MKFIQKVIILFLISSITNIVLAQRTQSFWGDSRYWMLENNSQNVSPLRQEDYDILSSIEPNSGALMSTAYSAHGGEIPQGAGALFYLAEMGLAILRNESSTEAEVFLNGTASTRVFYRDYAYKNVSGEYGMGRLVNSQARRIDTQSSIPLNQSLAFNYNAAYAYFLAVRNQLSEKYRGVQSFGDVSMAFKVYRYLHTQISVSTHDGEKYIKWKYGEHRPNGSADDISHAGVGARSLAYGSKYNYTWQWWSNMLFGNNRMASKILELEPTHMDFSGNLSNQDKGKLDYWRLPYPN